MTTYNYSYKLHKGRVTVAHLQSVINEIQDLSGYNTDSRSRTRIPLIKSILRGVVGLYRRV